MAMRRRRFGAQRIMHELREKGISDAAIGAAREQLKDSELDAARAVWRRKFKTAPADARERARQMRFLQGRGFTLDTIRRLLRDDDE
jgi:regulatory protein